MNNPILQLASDYFSRLNLNNRLIDFYHPLDEQIDLGLRRMLSDPAVSVGRFFDRPDAEKQFIYRKILEAEDPQSTLANYRAVLERINSPENYRKLEESGFFVVKRDEARTPEQTLAILERHFGLTEAKP